ncbi:MAG: hypothetical protein KDE06_15525 [Rhodobacteraceae bacterium]|nr:hypothetical protein [Paracoccaceae bacterium]
MTGASGSGFDQRNIRAVVIGRGCPDVLPLGADALQQGAQRNAFEFLNAIRPDGCRFHRHGADGPDLCEIEGGAVALVAYLDLAADRQQHLSLRRAERRKGIRACRESCGQKGCGGEETPKFLLFHVLIFGPEEPMFQISKGVPQSDFA